MNLDYSNPKGFFVHKGMFVFYSISKLYINIE